MYLWVVTVAPALLPTQTSVYISITSLDPLEDQQWRQGTSLILSVCVFHAPRNAVQFVWDARHGTTYSLIEITCRAETDVQSPCMFLCYCPIASSKPFLVIIVVRMPPFSRNFIFIVSKVSCSCTASFNRMLAHSQRFHVVVTKAVDSQGADWCGSEITLYGADLRPQKNNNSKAAIVTSVLAGCPRAESPLLPAELNIKLANNI